VPRSLCEAAIPNIEDFAAGMRIAWHLVLRLIRGATGFHVAADDGEGYYIHMVFPILSAGCCSLKTLQRCPR